jgi:hypothetical protein
LYEITASARPLRGKKPKEGVWGKLRSWLPQIYPQILLKSQKLKRKKSLWKTIPKINVIKSTEYQEDNK